MTEFKKKYGTHISDDRLPAQTMFERFSEQLADGTLKPSRFLTWSVCSRKNSRSRGSLSRHDNIIYNWIPNSRSLQNVVISARNPRTKKAYGLNTRSLPFSGFWPKCVSQGGQFIQTWRNDLLQTSLMHCLIGTTSIFTRKPTAARLSHSVGLSVCRKEAVRLCKEQSFVRASLMLRRFCLSWEYKVCCAGLSVASRILCS